MYTYLPNGALCATPEAREEINSILRDLNCQLAQNEITKTDLIRELIQAGVWPDNGMRSTDLVIQVANVRFNRG